MAIPAGSLDAAEISRRMGALAVMFSTPDAFLGEMQRLLAALGSADDAVAAGRYIPGLGEGYIVYGVRLPDLRRIAAETVKAGRRQPEQLLALARRLWESGSREARIIAAKMLEPLGKRHPAAVMGLAAEVAQSIRNWEECDQLGAFGLRHAAQQHPAIALPHCRAWVRDANPWVRRLGVVTLTSVPKEGGYAPTDAEFAILDTVMADEERVVQDAAVWLLREITRRDPAAVSAYLGRHVASKHRATRRIVNEALKVLSAADQEAIRALF